MTPRGVFARELAGPAQSPCRVLGNLLDLAEAFCLERRHDALDRFLERETIPIVVCRIHENFIRQSKRLFGDAPVPGAGVAVLAARCGRNRPT